MRKSSNFPRQNTKFCSLDGFTFIEVIASLLLLGILTAIIFSQRNKIDADFAREMDYLKTNIRYAQLRAQNDIYPWRLVFSNNNTYQLGPVVSPGDGFTPSLIPGEQAIERILGEDITTASGTAIHFDTWGRPTSELGAVLTSDHQIVLSKNGATETVTIIANTGLIQ